MLVQHRADIPPSDVVSQIQHEMRRQKRAASAAPSGESSPGGSQAGSKGGRSRRDLRKLLHLYLHGLFEVDMTAGKEYHGMQVGLSLYQQIYPARYFANCLYKLTTSIFEPSSNQMCRFPSPQPVQYVKEWFDPCLAQQNCCCFLDEA